MGRIVLRFRDLKARNIVRTWPALKQLVDKHGFPAGFMLGPNSRAWFEDEVEKWLAARPSALEAKPPLRGKAARLAAAKLTQGGADAPRSA